ncbi:MAG: hypothetical protein ACLS9K_06440 [Lachnospira eligens]
MLIDSSSRRNLELVETMREKRKGRFCGYLIRPRLQWAQER